VVTLSRGPLSVSIDKRRGTITQITSEEFPGGVLDPKRPLLQLCMTREGREDRFEHASVEVADVGGEPVVRIVRQGREERQVVIEVRLVALSDAVDVVLMTDDLLRPDRGMGAGLQTPIAPAFPVARVVADAPYSQEAAGAPGTFRRKYPTGDWMTSPQDFEDIRRPFTALTMLDLEAEAGRGLLVVHDGGQQFFRNDAGVNALLSMYDAWDEERWNPKLRARLLLMPHAPWSDAERTRAAALQCGSWSVIGHSGPRGDAPERFGMLWIDGAANVMAHALFRESMKSGEHLPAWAGHRMFRESGGACDHPYVVRLVEWDGKPAEVTLKLPGPIALAAKTNLLGEVFDRGATLRGAVSGSCDSDTGWLTPEPASPPDWAASARLRGEPIPWFQLRFPMRPREIATLYADLVPGRKQWRDLDAKREVWATVHRDPAPPPSPRPGR
jgi:alpha-mannosidase